MSAARQAIVCHDKSRDRLMRIIAVVVSAVFRDDYTQDVVENYLSALSISRHFRR